MTIAPYVKHALQEPVPARKYELWQHTKAGQICGFYWTDVDSAFENNVLPGWYYALRKGADIEHFVHESDIEQPASLST